LHFLKHSPVNSVIDDGIHSREECDSCGVKINALSTEPSVTIFCRMESNLAWFLRVVLSLQASKSASDVSSFPSKSWSIVSASTDQISTKSQLCNLIKSYHLHRFPNQWKGLSINQSTDISKRPPPWLNWSAARGRDSRWTSRFGNDMYFVKTTINWNLKHHR
jgi:hypothetical protein